MNGMLALGAILALTHESNVNDVLLNLDRKFSAEVKQRGIREAFLDNLSDDGLIFAPFPSNGKYVWKNRKPANTDLRWKPYWVQTAASGDLGWTAGPFRVYDHDQVTSSGVYVAFWRKGDNGSWKVDLIASMPGVPVPDAAASSVTNLPSPTQTSDDVPAFSLDQEPEQGSLFLGDPWGLSLNNRPNWFSHESLTMMGAVPIFQRRSQDGSMAFRFSKVDLEGADSGAYYDIQVLDHEGGGYHDRLDLIRKSPPTPGRR